MMLAILNWVLLAFLAISNAALIRIMLSRTGRCSIRNCMNCPYAGECPASLHQRITLLYRIHKIRIME